MKKLIASIVVALSSSFTQCYAKQVQTVCSKNFVAKYNVFVKERKNLQLMILQKEEGLFSNNEIKHQVKDLRNACKSFNKEYSKTICKASKSFEVSSIKGVDVKKDCDFLDKIKLKKPITTVAARNLKNTK